MSTQYQIQEAPPRQSERDVSVLPPPQREIRKVAPPRRPWYKNASYLVPLAVILMLGIFVAVMAMLSGGEPTTEPTTGAPGMQFVEAGTGPTTANELLSSVGTPVSTPMTMTFVGASTGPTLVNEMLSSVGTGTPMTMTFVGASTGPTLVNELLSSTGV